jgi:hypothetical protein
MQINCRVHTDDLDANFLESIKIMFKNKEIDIFIMDEDSEDRLLGQAIEEGLSSEVVSRDELDKALYHCLQVRPFDGLSRGNLRK